LNIKEASSIHERAIIKLGDKVLEQTIRMELKKLLMSLIALEIPNSLLDSTAQDSFSNNLGNTSQVESSSVIEVSKRKPNATNQHIISRIFDVFLKSILRNFVSKYVEDSNLTSSIAKKVGMNLMLTSTVSQIYQIATNSVVKTKISELIFNNMFKKVLDTSPHHYEKSFINSIFSNENYKWNTAITIYEKLLINVIRDNVCMYYINVVYDSEVMFKEIYRSILLGSFLKGEIITDCINEANASNMLVDSLLTSVVKKEILSMIKYNYYLKRQTCAVGNLLYSKFLLKGIAKEVADTRNKCFYHAKTAYNIYNSLITSEIKNYARELTEEKKIKMSTTVANYCYNKMFMNVVTLNILKDIAKPITMSYIVYSNIEEKVCKQFLSVQVLNSKVVSAVFDGLLKRQLKECIDSIQSNSITYQITKKLLLNTVNSLVKNIALNGITTSSTTNSVLTVVCAEVVKRIGKNMLDDLLLEGLEVLERDEAPRIDLKLRTKEHHNLLSKIGTSAVKSRRYGGVLHNQEISQRICQTSPHVVKKARSLDNINQEFLDILKKLENKEISFITSDKLNDDFKTIVTSALKINWNVSALERLELEPEKITKTNEARKYQVQLAQFSEELITLMQEKINALEQKEEEFPCEEETEDQEFVA